MQPGPDLPIRTCMQRRMLLHRASQVAAIETTPTRPGARPAMHDRAEETRRDRPRMNGREERERSPSVDRTGRAPGAREGAAVREPTRKRTGGLLDAATEMPDDMPHDNSDSSGEEGHDVEGIHPRFARAKRMRPNEPAVDVGVYPTLHQISPVGWELNRTAVELTAGMAQALGATDMLLKALAIAKVPKREVWGSDVKDVAEAALAVSLEAVKKVIPDYAFKRPIDGKAGLKLAIGELLRNLQQLAMTGGEPVHTTHGESLRRPSAAGAAYDAKPTNEFERGIAGWARVGPKVATVLQQQGEATQQWMRRATDNPGKIASNPPEDVLRVAMADSFSRKALMSELDPALATAIDMDARARAAAARAAVERRMCCVLPAKLDEQLFQTITIFAFSKMPSIADLAAELTLKNALGGVTKLTQSKPAQVVAAIRAGLAAAYPEFDFAGLMEAEDDFRGLLDGHGHEGMAMEAATVRAADLWHFITKHMEKRVREFCSGVIMAKDIPGGIYDIFQTEDIKAKLDIRNESNQAAMVMVASLTGGKKQDESKSSLRHGGKKSLASLIGAWKGTFGDACIFHFCKTGGCSKDAAACGKAHNATVDPDKLATWLKDNEADTSA